jgi:hypothetical protein
MFATPRASDQDDGFMAPLGSSSDSGRGGLGKSGNDAVKLTIDYVKQETLAPLKGLLRFAAAGVAGSFAIAIGVVLILVGALRVLQDETGSALTGDWSWVPYFAVSALGLAVAGVAGWRITQGPGQAKLPAAQARAAADAHELATKEGSS